MPNIQYEAAWCLTNIATGSKEQVQCLTEKGSIEKLIALMKNKEDSLKEQAIWALGNIAGENLEYRDIVLSHGALPAILNVLEKTAKQSTIKNGCWVLSTILRKKVKANLINTNESISILCRIIKEFDDYEILMDSCKSLSCLGNISDEYIDLLMKHAMLPRLIQLLEYYSPYI